MSAGSTARRIFGLVAVLATTLALAPAAAAPAPQGGLERDATLRASAATAAQRPVAQLGRSRKPVPEDRFAMAGGCYSMRTPGGYLVRADGTMGADGARRDAEPLHFQATALGRYLLYATAEDFLAASDGVAGSATDAAMDQPAAAAADGLTIGTLGDAAETVAQGPAGTASGRGADVVLADVPSELADWLVEQNQDGTFTFALPSIAKALAVDGAGLVLTDVTNATGFRLERTEGCGVWPEIDPGIDGPVVGGETPYGEVSGYLEAHLHMMAFEFLGGRARCGRPWHPYGVEFALRGCKEHEIAGGRAAVLETALSGRDPVAGHDTNSGWPTFTDWPKPSSLTYEQVYYTWMERAWRGGLRMFVNLLVDNVQLCNLYPYKNHGCDEMETVRLEAQRTRELQDYIDAQHGGPGRGWFRIVDDPFEARRVMNEGKLAVVLGIEVSRLFDCRIIAATGTSTCTKEQIDQRLDEVYDMGVRQMELVNKFDNALSGVTGDNAQLGLIVNGGNWLETGGFWQMRTCEDADTHAHDRQQYNFHDESGAPEEVSGRDSLVGILLQELGASGAAPAYGPGPHCNEMGLSELGEHLIGRMVDKGMIFDPDHMSAKARTQAMDIIEARGYSGVVSSHGWADDTIYPRIIAAGGVVTPHAGSSSSFVGKYRKHREWADDRYLYGIGFGADTNGFSNQGGPRGADAENPVTYPFTGFGGVTVNRNVSGEKTWDINTDGVAHYGLYVDWIEDVRRLMGAEGDQFLEDMARGPEAYLQMWERAAGVAPNACRDDVDDLGVAQITGIRKGMTAEQVLIAAGQPASRDGDTFEFCTADGTATITFGPDGTVRATKFPVRSTRVVPTAVTPQAPDVDAVARANAAAPQVPTRALRGPADRPEPAGGRAEAAAEEQQVAGPTRVSTAQAGTPVPLRSLSHSHSDHAHGAVALVNDVTNSDATRPLVLLGVIWLFAGVLLRRRRSARG